MAVCTIAVFELFTNIVLLYIETMWAKACNILCVSFHILIWTQSAAGNADSINVCRKRWAFVDKRCGFIGTFPADLPIISIIRTCWHILCEVFSALSILLRCFRGFELPYPTVSTVRKICKVYKGLKGTMWKMEPQLSIFFTKFVGKLVAAGINWALTEAIGWSRSLEVELMTLLCRS